MPLTNPVVLEAMKVRIATGVTMVVPSQVVLLTPFVLLEQETWFEDELGFLARIARPGWRCIDVGASYGLYSMTLAKAAGATGRVWSIEPASQPSTYLRESAAVNEFAHLTPIQKALSGKPGTAQLAVHPNSEMNSIAGTASGGVVEEVEVDTIDALAKAHAWSGIDFLKIDAEGEEARILEGASAFLAAEDPLVMFEIKHGDQVNTALVERFEQAGYRAYALVPGLDVLVPFDAGAPVDAFRLNLFACKPGRAARLEAGGFLAGSTAQVAAADPFEHYRAAHRDENAPALRVAHLRAAYSGLSEGRGENDPYVAASAARVARELGFREHAVELLNEALKAWFENPPGPPKGATLAPSPAFDAIAPSAETLKAALLDALVELTTFSMYYTYNTPLQKLMLDRLEALKATGYIRAPMERRRQLLRALCGLQSGPVADPAVSAEGPDNLNPGFWGP